ncbi:hypothetical protein [Oleispirillum naphthae]|uniref:hypothetical protein n=1 Tax=Oleispirillum naphthae TaxID=2838853 RepID=UPI00308226D8
MTFRDLPVLIANDRAQALAAFAAAAACGRAVQVETPADMAEVLGPAWMRAFLDACAAEGAVPPGPVVFHCGGSAGLAQAGLRLALPALRFDPEADAPPRVAAALAEIAAAQGSTLLLGPPGPPHWRFPPPVARPNPAALSAAAAAWLNGL